MAEYGDLFDGTEQDSSAVAAVVAEVGDDDTAPTSSSASGAATEEPAAEQPAEEAKDEPEDNTTATATVTAPIAAIDNAPDGGTDAVEPVDKIDEAKPSMSDPAAATPAGPAEDSTAVDASNTTSAGAADDAAEQEEEDELMEEEVVVVDDEELEEEEREVPKDTGAEEEKGADDNSAEVADDTKGDDDEAAGDDGGDDVEEPQETVDYDSLSLEEQIKFKVRGLLEKSDLSTISMSTIKDFVKGSFGKKSYKKHKTAVQQFVRRYVEREEKKNPTTKVNEASSSQHITAEDAIGASSSSSSSNKKKRKKETKRKKKKKGRLQRVDDDDDEEEDDDDAYEEDEEEEDDPVDDAGDDDDYEEAGSSSRKRKRAKAKTAKAAKKKKKRKGKKSALSDDEEELVEVPQEVLDALPPKPQTPYFLFMAERRAEVKAENAGMKIGQISKVIGEQWKALSDADKAEYAKRYQEMKKAYQKALDELEVEHPEYVRAITARKKKKGQRGGGGGGGGGNRGASSSQGPMSSLQHAIKDMKRRRRRKIEDLDQEEEQELRTGLKVFLRNMDMAAKRDAFVVWSRKPAMSKLTILSEVSNQSRKISLQQRLMDNGILRRFRDWLAPVPQTLVKSKQDEVAALLRKGYGLFPALRSALGPYLRNPQLECVLPNQTIRTRMYELLDALPVDQDFLKESEGLGIVLNRLRKDPRETDENKKRIVALIEKWIRPISQAHADYRHLKTLERKDEPETQKLMDERAYRHTLLSSTEPIDRKFAVRPRLPEPSPMDFAYNPLNKDRADTEEAIRANRAFMRQRRGQLGSRMKQFLNRPKKRSQIKKK